MKNASEFSVSTSVTMPMSEMAALKRAARKAGISVSAYTRQAIQEKMGRAPKEPEDISGSGYFV